jgi:hypothetical protein
MYEHLIILAALPVGPIGIVVAGLVLAAVIAAVAIFLLRGNKKKVEDASAASSANNWQPQMQGQPGVPGWGQPAGPQADAWGQQAGAAGGWGMPQQGQQAQMGGWGMPQQSQQAQSANSWGTPQSAAPWDAPAQQAQANPWAAPQSQPAAGWGAGTPQPAAGWDNPAQPGAGWGQQGQSAAPWDAPAMPAAQDPWGQAAQQGWGAPAGQPQQAPTAYGAGSNPSWNQNQTSLPGGQAAQAGAWGMGGAPGAAAAPATAPWQQQQPGFPAGAVGMPAPNAGYSDADKTMLRSPGSATGIGIVRVEEGKEPGKVYEIRKDQLTIGRSRESDIFLEDLAVSRFHASILNLGNGIYALKDEGSANGTKVNGQPVNKYQTYPLQEGDHIQLGQTVLVFSKR